MRKISVIILLSLIVLVAVNAGFAQNAQNKWKIELQPMWMDVYGEDQHAGDIFYYTEEWNRDTDTLTYGTVYDPINLSMEDRLALRGQICYMHKDWKIGVGGWGFNTRASQAGTVATPPSGPTSTGYVYYENGVRMWDHTIWPLQNDLHPSGISPVNYSAQSKLSLWQVSVFAIRAPAENKKSRVNSKFGLKLGTLNHRSSKEQIQEAYVYYENLPGGFFETYPDWPADYDFYNKVTLKSTSSADYNIMLGPLVGFEGRVGYKTWDIEGCITQSVLFGTVKCKGVWEDIDDMWYAREGTPTQPYQYLYGRFPFAKKEEVAVPVTELELTLTHQVRENLFLTAGTFFSVWWDMPVSPQFSIPGSWVSGEGTGWGLNRKTLIFKAFSIGLSIRL